MREASRQNLGIRVAGSGHSFTPVVATSGLLLSLKNMQGLVNADLDRKRIVVRAGTRIGDIGRALKRIGLSLANQGDIDTQAIAGALSTGTHGTGILRQYGARPHWGKLHFNRSDDMPILYPRFHDFQAIRRKMDPSGCFINDHLRNLFE